MTLRFLILWITLGTPLLAQHAYWRAFFTLAPTTQRLVIELLEFRDGSNVVIPTTGGTASASDTQGGSSPANAFTGTANIGTWWISNSTAIAPGSPSWLQYHFASNVTPAALHIYCRQNFSQQCPVDVALQYSDDGITYGTLYQVYGLFNIGNQTDGGGNHYWSLESSTQSPTFGGATGLAASIAYRINITANAGSTAAQIAALSMKNCSSSALTTTRLAAPESSVTNDSAGAMGPFLATQFWQSNGTPSGGSPEWIEYIFGSSIGISEFTITPQAASSAPSTFTLQHSLDGSTWTTEQSYTFTWPSALAHTFTVTNCFTSYSQRGGFGVQ